LGSRVAGAAIVGYLLSVAIAEVLRRTTGHPNPADLALTPARLVEGKVWLILTSALIVSGPPVLELLGLSIASALLCYRRGAIAFWSAAIAGHVGGTLIAYAGVGALWLVDHDAVRGVVHQPDYGVSAVWLGVLGALFVDAWQRVAAGAGRSERLLLAGCGVAGLIGVAFFSTLSSVEHGLAFLLGAVTMFGNTRRHGSAGEDHLALATGPAADRRRSG
jgi:hypothetical protein